MPEKPWRPAPDELEQQKKRMVAGYRQTVNDVLTELLPVVALLQAFDLDAQPWTWVQGTDAHRNLLPFIVAATATAEERIRHLEGNRVQNLGHPYYPRVVTLLIAAGAVAGAEKEDAAEKLSELDQEAWHIVRDLAGELVEKEDAAHV